MVVNEDNYRRICRVCLSCCMDKNMVSLVDAERKDVLTCYGIAVQTFANVEIKSNSLPCMMCQDCLLLLKQAIKFKKTCENSNEILKRLVQSIGDDCEQTKELITEYIMFSHYYTDVCTEYSKDREISLSKNRDCTQNSTEDESLDVNVTIERILETADSDGCFDVHYSSVGNGDNFEHNQLIEDEENSENSSTVDNRNEADSLLDNIEKMIQLDSATINSQLKKYKKKSQKKLQKRGLKYKQRKTQVAKKNNSGYMIKKKSNLKNIQCEICKMVLANWYSYKTHMQLHNGKRFICELCGKAFAIHAFLLTHQAAKHNCGKVFECTLCCYKAVRKWDLEEHHRVHTGERPYACDKCGMTFRRQYIWKKHALYHEEKTVQCPKCPCKFHQKGEMRAHYNNVHERLYVYECHLCGETYAKPVTVRRHLLDKHGIAKDKQGKIKRHILGRMNE